MVESPFLSFSQLLQDTLSCLGEGKLRGCSPKALSTSQFSALSTVKLFAPTGAMVEETEYK